MFTHRRIGLLLVITLTAALTAFFYIHELLPKTIRAATALFETPVAIASGLSWYFKLGIPVYETPWLIVLVNFIFSILVVYIGYKIKLRKKDFK